MPGTPSARTAGIVLCGGRSSRMGVDKAQLRMPGGTLLQRMVTTLSEVAEPVVLSLAARQPAPAMLRPVLYVRDHDAYPGPLWGLAEGFRRLQGLAQQVLVVSVDLPFYSAPWMRRLVEALPGHDAVLYRWEGIANALLAVYRLELLEVLEALIRAGERRPIKLAEGRRIRMLKVEDYWSPSMGSSPVMDIDTPEDYRQALLAVGIGSAGGIAVTLGVAVPTGMPRPLGSGADALLPLFVSGAQDVRHALVSLYPDWMAEAALRGLAPALAWADGNLARLTGPLPDAQAASPEIWEQAHAQARIIWVPDSR